MINSTHTVTVTYINDAKLHQRAGQSPQQIEDVTMKQIEKK